MNALANHIPRPETECLILRAPSEAYLDSEAEFFVGDVSIFVDGPPCRDDTWRLIAMLPGRRAPRRYGFRGVEEKDTDTYVGRIGVWFPEGWPEPEVDWTLMNHVTGKCYETEATLASRTHAYDVLGWETATSLIDLNNQARKTVTKRLRAQFDCQCAHPMFGTTEIWRHPAPDDLLNGGMETCT